MYIDKQKVLQDAQNMLNNSEQPWSVTIEGDSIIATWKWMDATFFSPGEINDEVKNYKFIVMLKDNGKWKERVETEEKTSKIDMNDGKISFGASKSVGNSIQKSITIGIGADRNTGENGIIKIKFDTSIMKEPIRKYLTDCGWKKAGLFG